MTAIHYVNYKKKNGPQRALDDYFEALNNLDRYAVWEVCNPPGQEYNDSGTLYYYFTNRLGYAQGIVQSSDFLRMDRDVMTKYLEGYGYTGDYYDMVQDRQSVTEDDSQIKKAMPGFRASYKLLKMKKASSCEIAFLKKWLAQGNYSTFENTTKYFDDIDYYMIIYKYGNKWYLYNENIIHWNYNISIKM
ncbi:MAG: hypothetical protein IJ167_10250 [Lachnospiraceae bacterium]|nr:hypothetical protein [Lachnospiraceae bacterium]